MRSAMEWVRALAADGLLQREIATRRRRRPSAWARAALRLSLPLAEHGLDSRFLTLRVSDADAGRGRDAGQLGELFERPCRRSAARSKRSNSSSGSRTKKVLCVSETQPAEFPGGGQGRRHAAPLAPLTS